MEETHFIRCTLCKSKIYAWEGYYAMPDAENVCEECLATWVKRYGTCLEDQGEYDSWDDPEM